MPQPIQQQSRDATADFYAALNDPSKWIIRPGVPVFKAHQRIDPATGQTINVDSAKLARIAQNMQRLERMGGVPVRATLGHTDPKQPETQQPPVAAWYRNARVAPFGPSGEPAVVCDEWLDPAYLPQRKNFPYRSSEYYDDTEQITGVALLARDPYLDLGVVSYSAGRPGPTLYSRDGRAVGYQYLLGDNPVYPPQQGAPAPAAQAPNGQPLQPVSQQQVPAAPVPTPYGAPTVQVPYVAPQPPAGYGYGQPAPGYVPPYTAPTAGYVPPVPYAAPVGYVPPNAYAAPMPYGAPTMQVPHGAGYVPAPVPYGYAPPAPYNHHMGHHGMHHAGYGDMGHTPHHIGHDHGGQGWHGGVAYDPPGAGPMGGHMEPDGDEGEGGLHMLHHHLGQAMEHLARHLNRAHGAAHYAPEPGAQNTPFPPAQPAQPMPPQGTADQPYGAPRHPHHGYAAAQVPVHYGPAPMLTITGQPVGQQLEMERLRAQIAEQGRVMQVVMYERDQADTDSCTAEIGRLAAAGYVVDENDARALKATPREHRGAFLQNLVTKYQKVGTEQLPQILGDPTASQVVPDHRPLSQPEMDAALRLTSQGMPYNQAVQSVQYARNGGQPAPPPQYGFPPGVQGPPNGAFLYGPHGAQPVMGLDDSIAQRFAAASGNGDGPGY